MSAISHPLPQSRCVPPSPLYTACPHFCLSVAHCAVQANVIEGERDACKEDLAKAQPFLDAATVALSAVQPAHIVEMRALKKPSDIIRVVFDEVMLLLQVAWRPCRCRC